MEEQAINHSSGLERFVAAQEAVFERALLEITEGRKLTHWMWFIFPQLRGLGQSEMAHRFGIAGLDEARQFLRHPVLGPRLRLAVSTLQDLAGTSAVEVFGPVDAIKLRSCLTLFGEADDGDLFAAALQRWFDGRRDHATLQLIASPGEQD